MSQVAVQGARDFQRGDRVRARAGTATARVQPLDCLGWVESCLPGDRPIVLWDNAATCWAQEIGDIELVDAGPGEWEDFVSQQEYLVGRCWYFTLRWQGRQPPIVNPAEPVPCEDAGCPVHGEAGR